VTEKWIDKAIKRPGDFSAKAKKAKMSTPSYAKDVLKKGSRFSTRTKKQANLSQTLSKMRSNRNRGRG